MALSFCITAMCFPYSNDINISLTGSRELAVSYRPIAVAQDCPEPAQ